MSAIHDIALLASGAGGIGIVGGIPAVYLVRANRRKVDATTGREEAETDSVIVTTTDRLVEVVNREIQRYEERINRVEGENDSLRREHTKCLAELQVVHTDLDVERRARKAQDERIDALLVEAENARDQRLQLTQFTESLQAQIATITAAQDHMNAQQDSRNAAMDSRTAQMDSRAAELDARETKRDPDAR